MRQAVNQIKNVNMQLGSKIKKYINQEYFLQPIYKTRPNQFDNDQDE